MPQLAPARVNALLERARSCRVAVVGDAMLDVYLVGDTERLSPEAPVPVVRQRERRQVLGGAANVAANVLALGGQTELVTVVGADAAGTAIIGLLDGAKDRERSVLVASRPTTCKTRIVARGQQVVRIDEEVDTPVAGPKLDKLLLAVDAAVADADAVVLEDYNKGVLTGPVIRRAIDAGRARGIPVVVDPKAAHFLSFHDATVFKPNQRELEAAVSESVDLADHSVLEAYRAHLGVEYLLVTHGAHGMALVGPTPAGLAAQVRHFPAVTREIFDVTGAGDTVSAAIALFLAAGASVDEAAWVASMAASVSVGKAGTATVTPHDLLAVARELSIKHSGR